MYRLKNWSLENFVFLITQSEKKIWLSLDDFVWALFQQWNMVKESYNIDMILHEYIIEVSGSYSFNIWFHRTSHMYYYSKFMFIFKCNILNLKLKHVFTKGSKFLIWICHIYEDACFSLPEGIELLRVGCKVSVLQLVLWGADISTQMAAEMRF